MPRAVESSLPVRRIYFGLALGKSRTACEKEIAAATQSGMSFKFFIISPIAQTLPAPNIYKKSPDSYKKMVTLSFVTRNVQKTKTAAKYRGFLKCYGFYRALAGIPEIMPGAS